MLHTITQSHLYADIIKIAHCIQSHGGKAFLVGGCVRDGLLGITPKDADIEVFNLSLETLESILANHFKVDFVGKSFGVFKLKGIAIDVSVPRTENKCGTGHQGFNVHTQPNLNLAQAALRRDFTINAIFYNPIDHTLHDPFNGQLDLQSKILKHVGPQFSEDPLRVLRAMQFISRFSLAIDSSTLALCKTITPETLPPERLFGEWEKLITEGEKPSLGLNFLKESHWVAYYPELSALINCPQDPKYHPEGDVWTHTLHCMDAFAKNRLPKTPQPPPGYTNGFFSHNQSSPSVLGKDNHFENLVVGLAVLCHDMGKPHTLQIGPDQSIRTPGHDVAGQSPTLSFLRRITQHKELIDSVVPLVLTHMRPAELFKNDASDTAVRRLAQAAGRIDRLIRVVDADGAGRPPYPERPEITTWLAQKAQALALKDIAPQPIIMGRHLIALGQKPSPAFSAILSTLFDAQLDGHFNDEKSALTYLESFLPSYIANHNHQSDGS